MKKGWTVTLEGRAAKALDPEDVLEQLAEYSPAVSFVDDLVSTTVTVDAHTGVQAIELAQEALLTLFGSTKLLIERIEAMTELRQEQELEISNLPDLVGIAEIAEMARTSRQRVFQMTANKGFPVAVLELRSGRLWNRAAIQRYLAERKPRLSRIKALESQVGGELHRNKERSRRQ